MKTLTTVVMGLCLVGLAGCASSPKDFEALAKTYYGQQRTYDVLNLSGVTKVSLEGADIKLAVKAEMQPLSILPRDNGVAAQVIQSIERTALVGAGIITAGSVMEKLADRPQVISQQVVKPTVITTK